MKEIIGMEEPFRYRNKSQFPVGMNREGKIVYGFYAGRTHSIIQTEDCLLGLPINNEIMRTIVEFMEQYHVQPYNEETGKGVVRHVLIRNAFSTGEVMVCLIINKDKLPHSEILVENLEKIPEVVDISINVNKNRNNVILGDDIKVLKGKGYIEDYIGDIKFRISPKSFFQVNPIQTKKLYDTALEYAGLTGKEVVWDLYCGIGSISLFLAKSAKKVLGVEIVPEAIDDARENAKINNIENATFFVGKAEEVVPDYYKRHAGSEETHPDVIVVDPPRKGCDGALIETMLEMQPDRIVYVSCDSATLARDLKILSQGGYEVKMVQPVDMFPQSVHVESVVLLTKAHN
jgi:23S rRNA (uracil1939-C5)-methyltransferase